MAVLAKFRVADKTEHWGSHYPPEHFDEDHYGGGVTKTGIEKCECQMIHEGIGQVDIHMTPVYSQEAGHENHKFWSATPTGDLKMSINNPAASRQFEVGEEYFIEIRKARK